MCRKESSASQGQTKHKNRGKDYLLQGIKKLTMSQLLCFHSFKTRKITAQPVSRFDHSVSFVRIFQQK